MKRLKQGLAAVFLAIAAHGANAATMAGDLMATMGTDKELPAYNVAFSFVHAVVETSLMFDMAEQRPGQPVSRFCRAVDNNGKLVVPLSEIVRRVLHRAKDKWKADEAESAKMPAMQFVYIQLVDEFGCKK